MASLKHVTREGLLAAMASYDELGAAAFHEKHGTNPQVARRGGRGGYMIEHGGKKYPSKAIMAAAAGLTPDRFSGGPAALGGVLKRAGLALVQLCLAGIVALAGAAPAAPATPALPTGLVGWDAASGRPAAYFASGSNQPANLRGFASVGQAIGVAAEEVSTIGEDTLYAIRHLGLPLFFDTSAFKEMRFGPAGPQAVYPISHGMWTRRLDLMTRVGMVYGSQAHLVAPDRVGCPLTTLARLERYRDVVRGWHGCGCNVLVCVQKSDECSMTQSQFDIAATAILGFDYVRAMPMSKNATTLDELRLFAHTRRPARMHLLGMGPTSKKFARALGAIAFGRPDCLVTCDSNLLTQSVGHTNGRANHPRERRGGPRVLTAARRVAGELISSGLSSITSLPELAIRIAFGPSPSVQLQLA